MMRNSSLAVMAVAMVAVFLTGCSLPQDDIDAFLKNPGVPAKKIEKVPSTKSFPIAHYSRDVVRDPFIANLSIGAPVIQEPPIKDEDRQPLEYFALENLTMTGMVNIDGKTYALIRDPESQVHRVTIGQRLGQNYGKVIQITRSGVQLEEQVRDGGGEWGTISSRLAYQEQNQLSRSKK